MTREELWQTHYAEVMRFMDATNRNPSKYNKEEMGMMNWLKANRKRRNAGKLDSGRAEKFNQLIERMERLHRKNQYTMPANDESQSRLFADDEVSNNSQD